MQILFDSFCPDCRAGHKDRLLTSPEFILGSRRLIEYLNGRNKVCQMLAVQYISAFMCFHDDFHSFFASMGAQESLKNLLLNLLLLRNSPELLYPSQRALVFIEDTESLLAIQESASLLELMRSVDDMGLELWATQRFSEDVRPRLFRIANVMLNSVLEPTHSTLSSIGLRLLLFPYAYLRFYDAETHLTLSTDSLVNMWRQLVINTDPVVRWSLSQLIPLLYRSVCMTSHTYLWDLVKDSPMGGEFQQLRSLWESIVQFRFDFPSFTVIICG
ncbi:hypothetical protein JAAARDRAFT_311825 [Jaapia argillacea MUCL 33604]|uniref:Uncharacterized protein n=1 Tax=Jaapia argillacea MUCL 33604 TaxID=933084 RepID=A0A067Q1I6_9AGAM|nr:hypothetical protein JAAARDRAFT_311825 [Jaapia argillacea MUCL 33604]